MKILITGASEGIGLAIAKNLAAKNNQITLVARNAEKLNKAISELPGKGHGIIAADLSLKSSVDALKEKIQSNKYDVLINNAGVGMYGNFTQLSLSEQVKMMDLNIYALTALSYFFLSSAKQGDALINIASVLGTTSSPGAAVYAATKAYVTGFSESLWGEYKNKGIYVAAFCPGITYTNFHNHAGTDKNLMPKFLTQQPEQVASELAAVLQKRRGPKIVSGFVNRMLLLVQRFLTRKIVVKMMSGSVNIK